MTSSGTSPSSNARPICSPETSVPTSPPFSKTSPPRPSSTIPWPSKCTRSYGWPPARAARRTSCRRSNVGGRRTSTLTAVPDAANSRSSGAAIDRKPTSRRPSGREITSMMRIAPPWRPAAAAFNAAVVVRVKARAPRAMSVPLSGSRSSSNGRPSAVTASATTSTRMCWSDCRTAAAIGAASGELSKASNRVSPSCSSSCSTSAAIAGPGSSGRAAYSSVYQRRRCSVRGATATRKGTSTR